jgi:hypothetical protein
MNKIFLTLASGVLVLAAGQATAADPYADNWGSNKPITLAVMGDWPYNTLLMKNAPLLINSINSSSPKVNRVMHVGDIHAGSMPCTSYGILPTITKADPGWSLQVYHAFQAMNAPVVYTPGDNEWTDCHRANNGKYDPLERLAALRQRFFTLCAPDEMEVKEC